MEVTQGNKPVGRIITLQEAAEILSVSYSTAFRLAESGELKAFRTRNSWRTSTIACAQYIDRQMRTQNGDWTRIGHVPISIGQCPIMFH